MNPAPVVLAARRFPLLGRPRPPCPPLTQRVQEIADIAEAAAEAGVDGLAKATHALNMAALVASDCGVPELARDLCWQHVDAYRAADHPLTVAQAGHMLEPVLNLARLQVRKGDNASALQRLKSMYDAAASGTDVVVDGETLPLARLAGTREERHKLRAWAWLHLVGDGVRTLTLAGRWTEAVTHAEAYRGIGLHLMEGRQATILAHCLNGAPAAARAALAASTPTQPWERQVASCLHVMCTDPEQPPANHDVAAMAEHLKQQEPIPGYAFYRAQLGLTITVLTSASHPDIADSALVQAAEDAIESGDGYAAREVAGYHDTTKVPTDYKQALADQVRASGLGAGVVPPPLLQLLLVAAHDAAGAVRTSVSAGRNAGWVAGDRRPCHGPAGGAGAAGASP